MNNVSLNPSVAIRCLVYNHEKYLRDCLDGIVMQRTDFRFFAVVHDDCSADNSVAIIREYQQKFPDIIHPLFEEVNCYSTDWRIADLKIQEAYGDAKYIAVCEGDDYWTDPYKLQKQVDYLESHPDYAVCAHETLFIDEHFHNKDIKYSEFATHNRIIPSTRTDYTFEEVLRGNIYHLSSLLFRQKDLIEFPGWRYRISAGDMILFRYLGSCGKTHWMPETMSVYRGHAGSVTSNEAVYNSRIRFNELNILVLRLLNRFWHREHQDVIYPIISLYYAECALLYTHKSLRSFLGFKRMTKIAVKYNGFTAARYILRDLTKRIVHI